MFDLELVETGNGGDLVKIRSDLRVITGLQTMVYIALFGGNPGFPTPIERPVNDIMQDFWGNSLISETPDIQFNSLTEQVLMDVALNSSGRIQIEEAVKADLEFLNEIVNVFVSVVIVDDDKVCIGIVLNEPETGQNRAVIFSWDNFIKELEQTEGDQNGEVMKFFIKTPEGNFILTPEGAKLVSI